MPPFHGVVSGASQPHVAARPAAQLVVAASADDESLRIDGVGTSAAIDPVDAAVTVDDVRTVTTADDVASGRAVDGRAQVNVVGRVVGRRDGAAWAKRQGDVPV